MKEATGELNMTVVTVVAIAAVAAFFYAFIWPGIKRTMAAQSVCANGPNYSSPSGITAATKPGEVACGAPSGTNGEYTCSYWTTDDAATGKADNVTCKSK